MKNELNWKLWWQAQLLTTIRLFWGIFLFAILFATSFDIIGVVWTAKVGVFLISLGLFLLTEYDGTLARKSGVPNQFRSLKIFGYWYDHIPDMILTAAMCFWVMASVFPWVHAVLLFLFSFAY